MIAAGRAHAGTGRWVGAASVWRKELIKARSSSRDGRKCRERTPRAEPSYVHHLRRNATFRFSAGYLIPGPPSPPSHECLKSASATFVGARIPDTRLPHSHSLPGGTPELVQLLLDSAENLSMDAATSITHDADAKTHAKIQEASPRKPGRPPKKQKAERSPR